jgi:hypothetical protein
VISLRYRRCLLEKQKAVKYDFRVVNKVLIDKPTSGNFLLSSLLSTPIKVKRKILI